MQLLSVVLEELPSIIQQLTAETLEDQLLEELIDSKRVIFSINEQAKLIESIFKKYLCNKGLNKHSEELEEVCFRFYKDVNIPFALIYKTLTNLKSRVMAHVIYRLKTKDENIFEIEYFIDDLINLVAKVYIKKDVIKLSTIYNDKFGNYLLFRSHLDWLENIVFSIKYDNLDKFPLQNYEDCKFSYHLQYPESLMVCVDGHLCSTLHDLHIHLHKNANTFYLFYMQGEFSRSYIVLQEFINTVTNFKKVITELYFLSFSNLEENFFRLIELLLYSKHDIYLTIIDFKKVRSLNAIYGETIINKLLTVLDNKLQNIVHGQEEKTLLVKATTANYYMLSIGISTDEIRDLNQELFTLTNHVYKIDNKELDVKTTIVTLSLDNFKEKKRDELTRMMLHLKALYKEKDKSFYVHNKKEILLLKDWLESSYKDMTYIADKLQSKDIDVVFQPLYDVMTGEVKVLEALARIKDGKKLVPAGVFIDTLYAMDKIEVLDQLMLEAIMRKKDFIKKVVDTMFVNVSYRSLFDVKYQKSFKEFLKVFDGYNVIFELTEQSLVQNMDKIEELHKLYDVQFAVDDFGTGYSSLKTVADLSDNGVLKVLKMDGEIIRSIDTKKSTIKIMKTIVSLAKELNLCSVAEFVESEEVFEKLQKIGVTYAQGYLLSKPFSIEELMIKKLNGTLNYTKNKGIL